MRLSRTLAMTTITQLIQSNNMFNNLPLKVKSLAMACYDQCSIDEIREDRDYPDSTVMADFEVNETEWCIAHDAAIEQKEIDNA